MCTSHIVFWSNLRTLNLVFRDFVYICTYIYFFCNLNYTQVLVGLHDYGKMIFVIILLDIVIHRLLIQ